MLTGPEAIESRYPFEARHSRRVLTTVPDNTPSNNATLFGIPPLDDGDAAAPRYPGAPVQSLRETAAGFPAPTWTAGKPSSPVGSSFAKEPPTALPVSGEVTGPQKPPPKPQVPAKPQLAPQRPHAASPSSAGHSSVPISSGLQQHANWPELYEQLGSAEKRRALRELQRKADQDALAEYERWATRSVATVMEDLARAAQLRASELLEATGKHLEVEYPSGPTVVGASGDAEIRFLKLSLGKACVHVYSSHARGSTTHIHLLPAFTDSLKKNHRLVSEPGAFVVRRPDDQYELRYFRGDPAATNDVMTVDLLLYKALRLLVRCSEDE